MDLAPSRNGRHTGDSLVALEHKFLMADAQPAFDAQLQHALPGAAQEARFCQVVGNTIYLEWMAFQCGYGVVMLKTAALMEALRCGR